MNCNYFNSDTIEKGYWDATSWHEEIDATLFRFVHRARVGHKVKILPSLIFVDQNGCFLRHA